MESNNFSLQQLQNDVKGVSLRQKWMIWAGGLALVLAAVLKLWLVFGGKVTFNGDEAVVGLMARHINQGEWPVFFYGQAYMGSLDAFLVAGAFRLFGEQVFAIRLVQMVLYLGFLGSLWTLVHNLTADWVAAAWAILLGVVPPLVVDVYTTASLGGYGESLLLGNLILILGVDILFRGEEGKTWKWAALGLAGGVAFWVLGIAGLYLLPIGLLGLFQFRKRLIPHYGVALLGFLLGATPWLAYNFSHGGAALQALGKFRGLSVSFFERLVSLLVYNLPLYINFRAPWSLDLGYFPYWLVLMSVVVYLGLLLSLFPSVLDRMKTLPWGWRTFSPVEKIFLVFGSVFLIIILGTNYGVDISGRYALPVYPFLLITLGKAIQRISNRNRWLAGLLVAAVLTANFFGIWLGASSEEKLTTQFTDASRWNNDYDQDLIDFLEEEGLRYGYSHYWVCYRLAFLSSETIIYSPRLPYKEDLSISSADQRIPDYDRLVSQSEEIAYITTNQPELEAILREEFSRADISWQEKQIGFYKIYYDFSAPVWLPQLVSENW